MCTTRPLLSYLLSILFALTPLIPPEAQAKERSAKKSKPLNMAKVKPKDRLGVLTMEQVARLSHERRVQYISLLRKTALELDKLQRSVKKGRFKSASLDYDGEAYAIYDVIDEIAQTLLGRYADAQQGQNDNWENACIYAGNKSKYPESRGGDEKRVPFECVPTTCEYGQSIKGIKCNYGYSGLVNEADMGCLPISAINPAYASKECWERRERLLGRKLIRENPVTKEFERINEVTNPQRRQAVDNEVKDLIDETNKFFGFNVGDVFYSREFQSEKAKELINRLVNLGYHDAAYAQLIKIAYFYKSNGQEFPPGTQSMDEGEDTSLSKIGSMKALERNFNNLNAAVEEIFFALRYHCGKVPGPDGRLKVLPQEEVEKIRNEVYLNSVPRNSSAYLLEEERVKHLRNLPPGTPATHGNVLEKRECELIELRFEDIQREISEIALTYPDVINGTRPDPVPEPPPTSPDDRKVQVDATGCTENVSVEIDHLVQPAARCAVCMVQTMDARKRRMAGDPSAGSYSPSKKYIALVSTMALHCGDAFVNDSSISGNLMAEYLSDFAYCASKNYEWRGDEDAEFVNDMNDHGNINVCPESRKDRRAARPKKNLGHPDHNNRFLKAFGLKFDTAKQLFCPPDRFDDKRSCRQSGAFKNRQDWERHDRAAMQRIRRQQFFQALTKIERGEKDSIADGLLECLKEARQNANDLHKGSNLCPAAFPADGVTAQGLHNGGQDRFLENPPVLFDGHSCYIPKARHTYPYYIDRNGIEKLCTVNDEKCDGERFSYLWVSSTSNEPYKKYTSKRGGEGDIAPVVLYSHQGSSDDMNKYKLTALSDINCPLPKDAVPQQPITTRKGRRGDR